MSALHNLHLIDFTYLRWITVPVSLFLFQLVMESIEMILAKCSSISWTVAEVKTIRNAVADSQIESGPWKAWSSPSTKEDPGRSH